jgi:uncharacterized protein (DUF1501 family)
MDRRSFLKTAGTMIAVPAIIGGRVINVWGMPGFLSPVIPDGRIMVLIQLDGGNDGLNMVIPIDQYSILSQLRPEIVIPQDKILSLDGKTGLHPSFSEIRTLYQDQKIMIIQNVGYPVPNLSHFRSKEIFLTASRSDQVLTTGWFGRFLSMVHPVYPENYPNNTYPHPLAISIGNMSSPSCQGNITDMGIAVQSLTASYQTQSGSSEYPDTPYGYELKYITGAMEKTSKYLQEVQKAGNAGQNLSSYYPVSGKNTLADQLKIVAKLISGGLNTPLYVLSLGGFDTHSAQVITSAHETGTHANQLKKVSEAIYAFLDDLKLQNAGDKVIGLIYSEFGRRIRSNKSEGTDHGEAYPMLLFGNPVNPVIYGDNPKLDISLDSKANIVWKTDFRSVYRSILTDWFKVDPTDAGQIVYGNFEHIQILKKAVSAELPFISGIPETVEIFPNPVTDNAVIRFFSPGGRILIKIVSLSGQEAELFTGSDLPKGTQRISVSGKGIPAGQYILVIESDSGNASGKIIFH